MPIYLRHANLCRSYCVRHVRHNPFDGKRAHPADRVLGEVFVEGFGVSVSKKSERLVVKKKGEVIFERPFFDVERVIVATEGATISSTISSTGGWTK